MQHRLQRLTSGGLELGSQLMGGGYEHGLHDLLVGEIQHVLSYRTLKLKTFAHGAGSMRFTSL